MKKITAAIICLSLLISLSGCAEENTEAEITTVKSSEITKTETEEVVNVTEIEETELSVLNILQADMPRMDGSTSAIPLEAGARAEILGITHSEAEKMVEHTKTHEAFNRLLSNEVDLILSVPVSAEQLALADEKGFTLESVPVAMEGFVFVVNIENPVDTLTSDELKKIYSGEITNWKEVGGLDEPIITYQRNADSGSQNYMVEFMNGIPLTDVPMSQVPGFMGGLMDAVSVYDNSRQAIGYSVYSYAAQMYANANQVKFIKVDGIEPSKQTFSDKTYPLLSCTYVFFDKEQPHDSSARLFAEWLSGEDGQLCVLKNGYVPVMDIEIPAEYQPYDSLGTGIEKPSDYKPSEKISYAAVYPLDNGTIDSLKNKELEAEINEWIEQAKIEMNPYSNGIAPTYSNVFCMNGYLYIMLGFFEDNCPYLINGDTYLTLGNYSVHFDICRTAVFDLFSGERIENFSDLFYKDVDFMPVINNNITKFISDYDEKAYPDNFKMSFSGLLGDITQFTFESVILEPDNPYFYCGPKFDFTSEELKDYCILWEYRDHTDLFIDTGTDERGNRTYQNSYIYDNEANKYIMELYLNDNGVYYERIIFSRFMSDTEIAEMNRDIERVLDMAVEFGYQNPRAILSYKNMYVVSKEWYVFDGGLYIDKETFEFLTEDDLFAEGWRDIARYDEGRKPEANDKFYGFYINNDECHVFFHHYLDETTSTYYTYIVPIEYLNERYR